MVWWSHLFHFYWQNGVGISPVSKPKSELSKLCLSRYISIFLKCLCIYLTYEHLFSFIQVWNFQSWTPTSRLDAGRKTIDRGSVHSVSEWRAFNTRLLICRYKKNMPKKRYLTLLNKRRNLWRSWSCRPTLAWLIPILSYNRLWGSDSEKSAPRQTIVTCLEVSLKRDDRISGHLSLYVV